MTRFEFQASGIQISLEIGAGWPVRLHRDVLYRLAAQVEATVNAEMATAIDTLPSAVLTDAQLVDFGCERDEATDRQTWMAGPTSVRREP